MDANRVPSELLKREQWVCWKAETRGGKVTKLPLNARTGKNASSTNAKDWTSFDVALKGCEKYGCSGVGFVFAEDRSITGVDLDHVLVDGKLAEEYQNLVNDAHTYTEVSPSGDGLHLLFLGGKPDEATKCKRLQKNGRVVEMYDCSRYFTFTGNVFGEHHELRLAPDVVEDIYNRWLDGTCKAEKRAVSVPSSLGLDDDAVLAKMLSAKNGDKAKSLMDGDTSAYNGDESSADLALCNLLAFWCRCDEGQMDRIFRTSGLMRDKWDTKRGSSTYGQMTVSRAIKGCADVYDPERGSDCSGDFERDEDEGNFGPWQVDEQGMLWRANKEGVSHVVTSTPPIMVADLRDVDSHDMRALVELTVRGKKRQCALDRETLLSNTKIIGALAPLGANVTSANAREVVQYLTECDARFSEKRKCLASVTHMGWADKPLGSFAPFDAGVGSVRFDPPFDFESHAKPFMKPKGTVEAWCAGVVDARNGSPAFRAVMAASFASPLVAVLGVQTFMTYLWGNSRSGKTPTLKAAGSVWGNPAEGPDSYYRTFNDTPKSIVRAATQLHDVPIIIDELQSKGSVGGQAGKRKMVEDLLYSLSLGHERSALNSNRTMMRTGSWNSLSIATGEIPILGDNTQQGASNRTLEINAEPFTNVREPQEMHRLVCEQYGTAGRMYLDALRKNKKEELVRLWEDVRQRVAEFSGNHPQTDNVALLVFADALAQIYVFEPGGDWGKALSDAINMGSWLFDHSTGLAGSDTDRKAIVFIKDWLYQNEGHFSNFLTNENVERYGKKERKDEGETVWLVTKTALDKALTNAGYDYTKTLRRMRNEDLLILGSNGFTKQVRDEDGRHYYVFIKDNALSDFIEEETS